MRFSTKEQAELFNSSRILGEPYNPRFLSMKQRTSFSTLSMDGDWRKLNIIIFNL